MLRRISRIVGSRVVALDGEVGKVHDAYIDDAQWVVRYLVVATGGWLSGRKVLVSPQAVEMIDHVLHAVSVSLTRERVRESPNIETPMSPSRGRMKARAGMRQWVNGPLPPGWVTSRIFSSTMKRGRSATSSSTRACGCLADVSWSAAIVSRGLTGRARPSR